MVGRSEQKERTRRAIIEAALGQISAERGFSSLSLREVARGAGIAPTSFYRHFRDLEELGLTLVDEAGVTLRRLMRRARQRFEDRGDLIRASVETIMDYLGENPNILFFLARERAVGSQRFRSAIRREFNALIEDLASDLELESSNRGVPMEDIDLVAEAMVTLVFNQSIEALGKTSDQREGITERIIRQLRMVALGSEALARRAGNDAQRYQSEPQSPMRGIVPQG